MASTLNTSILNGRVTDNPSITALPMAASTFSNLRILHEGNSVAKVEIENNIASSTNLDIPVIALSRFGNTIADRLDLKMAGNTITQNTAMGLEGIELRVGTSTIGTGINTLCAYVLNNNVTVPSGQRAFRARIIDPTSFMSFQGAGPDVPSNWSSNMNSNSVGAVIVGSATVGAAITFGSVCASPGHPLPPLPPPPLDINFNNQNVIVIDTTANIEHVGSVKLTETPDPIVGGPLLSMSGETVTVGGMSGFLLPADKSLTILFRVKINDPFPDGVCMISNQGLISGGNFSMVLTDDPNVGGSSDPTVTQILIPPSITDCQDDIMVGTDPDLCSASVLFSSTVTGCPAPTLTYMIGMMPITSPHIFPLGVTTVDVKASNGLMPDAVCSFTITVTDDQTPTLTCLPGTQMRGTTSMACTYTVMGNEFDPVVNENCPGYTLSNDFNNMSSLAGEVLPEGMHPINWTIEDGAGLMASCSITIEVTDGEDPSISCPPAESTECDIADLIPYSDLTAFMMAGGSVSDNCMINDASFMYLGETGGPANFTRMYQISDVNGNTSTCMQTVTVNDMIAPVITPGTIADCYKTLELAETAAIDSTSATDNCTGMLVYTAMTSGDCDAMITVTVKDAAGNSAFTVYNTRIDGTAPMVTKGMIAACYATANQAETAALNATSAMDNCAGALMTSASTIGTCDAVITITITDQCGNSSEVMYNTIIDDTSPMITKGTINHCYPSTNDAEMAAIAGTTATDNCLGVVMKTASTVGLCSAIITVTATDECGNSAMTSYNTRIDNTPPTVMMGTIAPSYPSITAAESAALLATTATDNCSGSLTEMVSSEGECSLIITVTTTDSCGNSTPVLYMTRIDLAGAIGGEATICAGDTPGTITETQVAGGTGVLSYRWQKSDGGCMGSFMDIPGAMGTTYDPPPLIQSTSYRRIVTSTVDMVPCSDTTNCVTVTVNQVDAGTIGIDEIVCSGDVPSTIQELTPAMGSSLTYQWQKSTDGCSGTFSVIEGANSISYSPPALFVTTSYRRIAISTLNMVECRDTSNCVTITVRAILIDTIIQMCLNPMLYDLKVCLDITNPGPSGMFSLEVDGLDYGPFSYGALDPNGCYTVSNVNFDPSDLETFDVMVKDVDGIMCADIYSFTEKFCFECPLIGSINAPMNLCQSALFDLTATGLQKMAISQNSETDFGIKFVAFAGAAPINPYVGGISLGIVPFGNLTMSNSQATLQNINAGILGAVGTYTICAILSPAPTIDNSCRPFQSKTIMLDAVPVFSGVISGPVTVCPNLDNLQYSIQSINNATSYSWTFDHPSGTISGTGTVITLSLDHTFSGGKLSVIANNQCGSSPMIHLDLVKASDVFCQLTSCLAENQNITVTDALLMQMGSPDVYKAINRLESGATIVALRNITFKAGSEILLKPPFNVELGATFIAEIEPCIYSVLNNR
ncbi:MAG: hypothetical protein IPL46_32615 [Saprospiraceae bacterium]|nr:hypothetical protein [Saprospiraceae bacterium]